jgi:DNA-binding NarL/FixJ family response regulator
MPAAAPSPTAPPAVHFVLIEDDVMLCDLLARAIMARFAPRTLRTFHDGGAGLEQCLAHPPDLLITDLRLPGVEGREIIRRVRARHPGTRCVVLTSAATPALPAELLTLGVSGFVDKSSPVDHLERAIERVMAGGLYFSTQVTPAPAAAKPIVNGPGPGVLTEREREIARLVAGGLISKEIAERLGLSPRTVEKERGDIMAKIGVRDLSGFIRWCVRNGLG